MLDIDQQSGPPAAHRRKPRSHSIAHSTAKSPPPTPNRFRLLQVKAKRRQLSPILRLHQQIDVRTLLSAIIAPKKLARLGFICRRVTHLTSPSLVVSTRAMAPQGDLPPVF
jgi:hypothetical protein